MNRVPELGYEDAAQSAYIHGNDGMDDWTVEGEHRGEEHDLVYRAFCT